MKCLCFGVKRSNAKGHDVTKYADCDYSYVCGMYLFVSLCFDVSFFTQVQLER